MNKDVLISAKQIAIRFTELAREISTDYKNAEMVALVVVSRWKMAGRCRSQSPTNADQ